MSRKFQSTHPVWGATRSKSRGSKPLLCFNPRTPCGVRHSAGCYTGHPELVSIHAPRVGCDDLEKIEDPEEFGFNPRTPCGVRLFISDDVTYMIEFQSTHPVWGATSLPSAQRLCSTVSIHAPRVGCDRSWTNKETGQREFQSTHPVWGATGGQDDPPRILRGFNPRTPCGVRLTVNGSVSPGTKFQSTHPVWGATFRAYVHRAPIPLFQSTHPVWGATSACSSLILIACVSIHAPRVGCDTMPHRYPQRYSVSIHAPRVGCDFVKVFPPAVRQRFNPRTPCGVRLDTRDSCCFSVDVSIHAPRVGCDFPRRRRGFPTARFNPRTPCGVRLA